MKYIELYGRHSRSKEIRRITTSVKNIGKYLDKGYASSEQGVLDLEEEAKEAKN